MGLKDYSSQEILGDLQPHINIFRSDYNQAYKRVQNAARAYKESLMLRDVARIKLLYLEALRDDISLERVRGRAEAAGLKPEDFEGADTEMEIICELFKD